MVLLAGAIHSAAPAEAQQRGRRQAQPSWWQRTESLWSRYYLIRTDLPKAEARDYARHLDRMYEEYSRRLASLPPRAPEKLNVLIFKDRLEYLQTLRLRFGIDGTGTGGMFFVNPQGSGLAFWTGNLPRPRIEHVMQHEGFHQFAYSRFGNDLPVWVNEGLAEFFGEAVLVGNTFILGQSTPRVVESVKNAIELDEYVHFRRMLSMSPGQWMEHVNGGDSSIMYHQAWSMVHFLVYGEGGRYQSAFEEYLRQLNKGIPPEHAFVRVFGEDVNAFEERWLEHARSAKPSAFITALERIEFLAEGALELSRDGIVPESLEELKEHLREIGFTHTVGHHGLKTQLSAEDDATFTIPMDGLTPEQPVFVVEKPKLRFSSIRERRAEEAQPTPCAISTENLRPRRMEIRWIRDRDTLELHYEIVIR
jgi:hypothetical protein